MTHIDDDTGYADALELGYGTPPAPPADELHAERLLSAYRWHLMRADHITDLFGARIREMEERRDDLVAHHQTRIEWLTATLELHHRARLADDPKALSIVLPSGTLRSTALRDRWTFGPEFVAWAEREHPDVLAFRPTVISVGAQALVRLVGSTVVDSDGQIVPGATCETAAERGGRSFRVELPGTTT